MFIPFEEMAKRSRVWIYQADRKLKDNEVEWLEKVSTAFCDQWAAHGADLKSSFQILHDQFLILAVDEEASLPSGCSIDSSVHLVQQAQSQLGIDFFDRMKVAFYDGEDVELTPTSSLKGKIASGEISEDTLTFNNLVGTINELESAWKIPAGQSWLKRYFVQ